MGEENDSKKAISGLNGKLFMGKTLTITEAIPRQTRAEFHEKKGVFSKDRGNKKAW